MTNFNSKPNSSSQNCLN